MTDTPCKPNKPQGAEEEGHKKTPKSRPMLSFLLRTMQILLVGCLGLLLFVGGALVYSVFVVQQITVESLGRTHIAGFVFIGALLLGTFLLLLNVSRLLKKMR